MKKVNLFHTNVYTSNITKNPHIESYKVLSNLTTSISTFSLTIRDILIQEWWLDQDINDSVISVYPFSALSLDNDLSAWFDWDADLEQSYLMKSQQLDHLIFDKPGIIAKIADYSEPLYYAKNTDALNRQITIIIWIVKEYLEELKQELWADVYVRVLQEYHKNNHIAFNFIEFTDGN